MSFSAHYLSAVLLTILSLPTSQWAQSPPKQNLKTPRSSISGRVTIKEKGVAGVTVALRKSESMGPYEPVQRGVTDPDGFYRIVNVPPGAYEVMPSAPAFVPAGKDLRSKSVLVGEDDTIENINFTLVRGGVITGKVTDADGHPVVQQQVSLYQSEAFAQQQQPSGQRQIYPSGGAQTDDRGIYRVFGLVAGRYKVATGRSEDVFMPQFGVAGRSTYAQVFHPETTDQAKATVIEVGEGTEATNVDITLGRVLQTFAVAGRVVDGEKGLPVPNARLGLQRSLGQRTEFVNTFVTSNAQGDFVAEGLIPGKYGFFMYPNENGGKRVEALTFDIIDQDVSGITVKIVPGASLSGFVVLETENKALLAQLSELQLRGFVTNPSGGTSFGMGSSASSPIAPDGSFQLGGLPGGMANLMLGSMMNPFPPKGFSIARVERDGVAMPRGIEIKEGEQLTSIRVVVAYGNATLRGVVKIENGTLPDGARIFVRLMKPGENSNTMRPPQVDTRGHFLVEGLPAGTYEVQATVGGVPQMRPRNVKREVEVQDGVITDVVITVDMSAPIPQSP